MATNLRPLTKELQEVAKNELNEVENRIPADLAALKEWISKQPHLIARTDDQFLICFLRGCKYSLEKAKSKIDYYFTIRTIVPEVFGNNHFDGRNIELCRSGAYIRLPKPLGIAGPRLHLTCYSRLDANKFKILDLFRYQSLLTDMHTVMDDNCIVSGYLEILDLSNLHFGFIAQFDPMLIKKVLVFADKAEPIRMKGVHLVNVPKEIQTILNLVRSLMSEKLRKRFYVHKNFDALYEIVAKEYLPIEYGGTNGSIADIQIETEQQLLAYNNEFIANDKYGVNEQLRSGKKFDKNTLFGMEGSFRKLDID